MRCGVLRGLVLASAALVLSGCGGDSSGPRGLAAGAGSGPVMDPGADPTSRPSLRTVVYLPSYKGNLSNWRASLDFSLVSYINLSFITVDAGGSVSYPDATLGSFVSAVHAAGAKVCVALGGATTIDTGGVFATLLQDDKRPQLVDNLVSFVRDNQLDCLDVDLEGNGVNQYYEAFVVELGAKLHPEGHELSAAVAAWFGQRISDKALATFDFINVMAYDLYSNNNDTPMQTSSLEAATREVDKWVTERGVPREKVVYGVPFYGFRWPVAGGRPETVGYGDLLRIDGAAATQDQLQGAGTITYLNSRVTIQAKAQVAKTYGGIMAWEASQDASGEASLLQAIHDAVE